MSYRESQAKCDWCSREIINSEYVACGTCHEKLEQKVQDLEGDVARLKVLVIAYGSRSSRVIDKLDRDKGWLEAPT